MDYRTLGSTGTAVSELALGTMTFGAETDEETSFRMVDTYLEAGGNFLDTADVYGRGTSEEIVGRWLASHPTEASQVVVATKGRFPMGETANDLGLSRTHLRRALDGSLARLGVDCIDLYQMHAWDGITPLEETLRFLDDAVRAGKISYYGFSNYYGWQIAKAVELAKGRGWTTPVTLQSQYNLLVRGIEIEAVPASIDGGLGLLPWSPLGGGWLSGKYSRDTQPSGATRLGEHPERGMESWTARNSDARVWDIIDLVKEIADEHGVSASQVSLAWLAAQPQVTSIIVGARTMDQLTDNLGSVDLELSIDEVGRLSEASSPRVEDYPYGEKGTSQMARSIRGGR